MRSLKYLVGCSVDGFIAHQDGRWDGFLFEGDHIRDLIQDFPETLPIHFRTALGINAENQCFDTVLMGRNTYESGASLGITNPYPQLKQYLFSRSLSVSPDTAVELVSQDAAVWVHALKRQMGRDIWLCGGGQLAANLASANLIDQLILKINPFVMGEGIPLFSGLIEPMKLELLDRRIYHNGVLRLHYQVNYAK